MIRHLLVSALALLAFSCGKSDSKKSQPNHQSENLVAVALAGLYQQVAPGIARLEISEKGIVTGTTIEIPGPAGSATRYTPQFPQELLYNAEGGYFTTIGTYNDNVGVFQNVELRLRLSTDNQNLDVTLVTPPDEAIRRHNHSTEESAADAHQGRPSQNEPVQQGGSCSCPEIQQFYVYRFERI